MERKCPVCKSKNIKRYEILSGDVAFCIYCEDCGKLSYFDFHSKLTVYFQPDSGLIESFEKSNQVLMVA